MELIDIGINLTHDSFDADRDQVIARAHAAGVSQLVCTGASLAGSRAAVALAHAHPGRVFATAGVHPHHATDLQPADDASFGELLQDPAVVAVGECGLDYFRNFSPQVDQRRAFAQQLRWAVDTRKPVFLHQRDAHDDFVAMLREHRANLAAGVAHCFTGNGHQLRDYLELDLAIGITGWICDERRGLHLRELVAHIPRGRLMLETDGPYLLPRDLVPRPASRRNEPAYLAHITGVVARCRGETAEDCATHTTETARRFFGLTNGRAPTSMFPLSVQG